MSRNQYDFLIIGSGIAGLNFALNAAKHGKVLVVTKKKTAESNTNLAQGGIAAVLDKTDNFKKHIKDTLEAGSYHNNKKAVEFMVKHGPAAIKKLIKIGVPFAKRNKKLLLTKEGGHSSKRIAFVGDYTGREIEAALVKQIKKNKKITLYEHTFAVDLLVKNKTCYGITIIKNNKFQNILARTIVLTTGGLGQVYKHTTNPEISTGDGIGMAYRAGCKFKDLEFIQFHPTVLNLKNKPLFLISEAVRGEGAILLNYKKQRFTQELAPRDIVAQTIYQEEKKGPIYLDITHKNSEVVKKRFPEIYKELKKYNLDLTKDLIPISPAAHYSCGGIKVNLKGKTNIKNLYAFGEVTCTGVHGANRLASNSLLEALVFSEQIIKTAKRKTYHIPTPPTPYLLLPALNKESSPALLKKLKSSIQNTMWTHVGIVRTKKGLQKALKELERIEKNLLCRDHKGRRSCLTIGKAAVLTIELFELINLLQAAKLITKSALKRPKSLGSHYMEM